MLGGLVFVHRETAENAVRTLVSWTADDPTREGLHDTLARVVRSCEEMLPGYLDDPAELLSWRRANACA